MPSIYEGKACSLVTRRRLKISRVSSLPLNCILLFLQLDVIILDLGQEYSFVKKRRVSFSLTEILVVKKKKKQLTAGLSLGAVLSRRQGVIPILACSKNAFFFSFIPGEIFSQQEKQKMNKVFDRGMGKYVQYGFAWHFICILYVFKLSSGSKDRTLRLAIGRSTTLWRARCGKFLALS